MVNMTLGIVATKSTQEIVQGMNFRGNLDIRILEHKQLRELVQTIESQPCFSHILLDVEAVQGNSDDFIQLLFRLRQSTTVEYLVLLEGYPSDSRVVKELLDLGIESKDILFSSALALRQRLVEIFYYPSSQITPFCPTKPMNETPEDDETIEQFMNLLCNINIEKNNNIYEAKDDTVNKTANESFLKNIFKRFQKQDNIIQSNNQASINNIDDADKRKEFLLSLGIQI